ncbi:sigma-70 family RNA polymerase sigma factor [Trinickia sp.]|uniref:sigma-70 family RNA polymerase sigma factor n=1 Tax=Trinickia sp. TaxID=2571163 RepID=UPI003F7EBA41
MRQEEKDKISSFEAARARLTSIAYRMLGSRAEAEDIVQDAWLKWHAAAQGELRTPLAWLTTVTTRLAIDRIRRLQSEQTVRTSECLAQPWLDEMAPSAEEEALHASSVSEAVELLFERLSADERAAFVLHEAFDYDYAQIAQVVGKTPAHCRQLAHRARRRLMSEPAGSAGRAGAQRRDGAWGDPARADGFERLREVIRRADAAAARQLLADRAVMAPVAANPAARPSRVAEPAAEDATAFSECSALEAHALPCEHGVAFALVRDCDVVAIVRVTIAAGRWRRGLYRVELVRDGAQIDALNRRFGSHAIAQRLARIAAPTLAASAVAA